MSTKEIINKIEALAEWETIIEEAKAEAEALRDSIKAEMLEQNIEELEAGAYIIRGSTPPPLRNHTVRCIRNLRNR